MTYIKYFISVTAKLLLGDPNNYRMLGVYTEGFGDCATMKRLLPRTGLSATMTRLF